MVIVEIGNDWLKVIQVDRGGGGFSLARVALDKLDPIRGPSSERLATLLRPFATSGGVVYGCLPRQLATVRILELPSTNPVEIGDMVELQAGKLTPYTKEEIVADYKIVGPGREGYTKVMLVIVQRSVLRNRFSVMEEAGVPLATMSVGTEGILNWMRKAFPAGGHAGAVAVLDVDAGFTDFAVIAQDRLLYTRSILIGTAALQSDEGGAREKLGREVLNALQTFAGENAGVRVERLLLSGAARQVPDLAAALRGRVEMPVESADCLKMFRKTPGAAVLAESPHDLLSLTPLCGMALDLDRLDFRLVPESVRLRKELVMKARALNLLGCLIMTTLVLISMWSTLRYCFKYARLADVRQQVVSQEAEVRTMERKMRLVEVVQQRRDQTLALFNLLHAVHQALPKPDAIIIDGVEFDDERGSLQVGGSGATAADVRELVKGLEKSGLLRDVREEGTTQQESSGRFRFRVVCRMEGGDVG